MVNNKVVNNRRNIIKALRAIIAAKSGGKRWLQRARERRIPKRAMNRTPSNNNNRNYVMYNGRIMTYNQMQKEKEIKRLVRNGYNMNTARNIVNRYGV